MAHVDRRPKTQRLYHGTGAFGLRSTWAINKAKLDSHTRARLGEIGPKLGEDGGPSAGREIVGIDLGKKPIQPPRKYRDY